MEPRLYDGMAPQQGYYQKNLEEVLKPYIELDMKWNEYADKVQEIYETGLSSSIPILVKYPVMSTKFLEDDRWVIQRHDPQYIDRVFKRFSDQDYEYQIYVPSSDVERFTESRNDFVVKKQKDYLSLKFKEHQRRAKRVGGKEELRKMEREEDGGKRVDKKKKDKKEQKKRADEVEGGE